MDFAARAALLVEFTGWRARAAASAVADATAALPPLARAAEAAQRRFSSEASKQSGVNSREWSFMHGQGRESQECSLVELLALGEVAPGLVINSCEQNLSLRLVDALGGAGKVWALYREGRRARREIGRAEKCLEDAQRALKQATVHDEAARKCSDLIAQSEEIWESCGRHISSREVQHLVHHQGFPPSTTLHGSGCIMKTAREVILSLEASVRAAQQVLLACPGYKEIVSLDPSDPDICCWGWTVDGTRYGPYSLKDLRCWVKMGSIQSDGLISHSSQPDRYANIHEVLFYLELQALAFWMDLGLGRAAQHTGQVHLPNNGYKNGERLDRFFDPMDFINSLAKPKAAHPRNLTTRNSMSAQEDARKQKNGSALASQASTVALVHTSPELKGTDLKHDWKEKPERELQEIDWKNTSKDEVAIRKFQALESNGKSMLQPRKKVVLSLFRAAEQGAGRVPPHKQDKTRRDHLGSGKAGKSVKVESAEEADLIQNGAHVHEGIAMNRSLARKQLSSSGESDEIVTHHVNKHKVCRGQEASAAESQHPDDLDEASGHVLKGRKQWLVDVPATTGTKMKRNVLEAVKATNILVSELEKSPQKQCQAKKMPRKSVSLQHTESRWPLQHVTKKRKVCMESSKVASDLEGRSLRRSGCTSSKADTTCENSSSMLANESAGHLQSSSNRLLPKSRDADSLRKAQQLSHNSVSTGKRKKSHDLHEDVHRRSPCMDTAAIESMSVALRASHESSARGINSSQEELHSLRGSDMHKSKSHKHLVRFKHGKQTGWAQEASQKKVDKSRQKINRKRHSDCTQDRCVDEASVSLKVKNDEKASRTCGSGGSLPLGGEYVLGRRSDETSTQPNKHEDANNNEQVCHANCQVTVNRSDVSKSKTRSCHSASLITKSHTSLPEEPSEATQSDPPSWSRGAWGQSTTGCSIGEKADKSRGGEDLVPRKSVKDPSNLGVQERIHMLISDLKTPSFAATPPASPQHCEDLIRIKKVLCDLQTPAVSGSFAGTPDPVVENGKRMPSCTHSAQDKGSARGASDCSELGTRSVGRRSFPPGWQGDAAAEENGKDYKTPQAGVEQMGVLTEVKLDPEMDNGIEFCEDEEEQCGSLSDVPLAKRRVLLAREDLQERPKEVKRRVKQANRRRIPIVTTRPSRPGPKTKRAIRYATPSATPSLQTFQSMHNGCSNSRTVTAATVKRKSTPDDGISGDCRNICARNLVYASIIRKKKQQRAEAVQDTAHGKSRDSQSARGDIRNRALRIESRQVVRSDVADASKWKNTVARGQTLRLGRSCVHAWGLYATEKIEPETFVIEYTGQVIRKVVSELREKQYEADGLGSSYLFRLDDEYVVDATKRGGLARFINHSCDPNCYTKIITVDGQKKIGIYSRRSIVDGEELFYDYKFDYEEEGKRVQCHCDAKTCRGFMN